LRLGAGAAVGGAGARRHGDSRARLWREQIEVEECEMIDER